MFNFKKAKTAESQSIDLLTTQVNLLTDEVTRISVSIDALNKIMKGLLDEAGLIRNNLGK